MLNLNAQNKIYIDMKIVVTLLCFIGIILISGCGDKNKQHSLVSDDDKIANQKSQIRQDSLNALVSDSGISSVNIDKPPRPLDSINHKNAIDFLIKYGKENLQTKVKLETKYGDIIIKLFPEVTLHRANFIFLVNVKYFDYTAFHRVAPDFVIQGGMSELRKSTEIRNKYKNYTIPPEFKKNLKHHYGRVATARQYENNISKKSNPFEFYIVTKRNGTHHLDGEHTIFGEVISGMPVAEKISRLKTGSDEWPYEDIFIKATVID